MKDRVPDQLDALLDQARYLLDEIESLVPVIGRLSDEVLEARLPPTERSVKEFYGAIVEVTEARALPALRADEAEEEEWPAPDEVALRREWNAKEIRDILGELRDARQYLLEATNTSRISRTAVEAILGRVVAFDLQCQRLIGERLFDVQPPPRLSRLNGDM